MKKVNMGKTLELVKSLPPEVIEREIKFFEDNINNLNTEELISSSAERLGNRDLAVFLHTKYLFSYA